MWLCGETGERWQAQDLTAAEAAKVDQYVAAVEAGVREIWNGIRR